MRKYLKLQDRVLPLNHPRVLLETAQAQGASFSALLAGTGITEALLADPDARISYLSFGMLTTNALHLTGNPALGIDFGRNVRITNLGMTGLAMMASPTVEQALHTHLRFGAIFAPAWDASLQTHGPLAVITALSVLPFGELRAFAAEALLAAIIATALDGARDVLELRFDYPAPRHAARYADISQAPIRFGQPVIELVFDAAALQRALPAPDPLTRAFAMRQCELDLARLPARKRLVSDVRARIEPKPGVYASFEAVAEELDTTTRTLRRDLKELGTSYQMLLDERRRENVLHYLQASSASLENAAMHLGFSDVRSLRRSVRRWTGMSLQELRAQARAHG